MSQRAGNLGQDGCARDPLSGAAISLTPRGCENPTAGRSVSMRAINGIVASWSALASEQLPAAAVGAATHFRDHLMTTTAHAGHGGEGGRWCR